MIFLRVSVNRLAHMRKPTAQQMQEVEKSAATELRALLMKNFEALPGETFYKAAARKTEVKTEGDKTQVLIFQRGVHLQWMGGTIRPTGNISEVTGKPIRHLLIPWKNGPLDDPDISLVDLRLKPEETVLKFPAGGAPVLVRVPAGKKKGKKGKGTAPEEEPLGTLVSRAVIPPHPEVIPAETEIHEALKHGAEKAKNALKLKGYVRQKQ